MPTRGKHTHQDTTTRSLVKAGPSHTTTPTTNPQKGYTVGAASDPEKPEQPTIKGAGPIPQDPTARLNDPHPHIHVPHIHPKGLQQY
jgi:hypothetical protein